ncbi:hypothetical protein chiPu_0013372 [Chiloscyllium punctatum]|uniref:Thioredoxin domain-containing protein n=1 Tax=Chiloscyllium punctatum TaxID=137246 RepID=A0A401SWX7_CHIPU|nr:hypothetical protein [Chiloscyllium punctatum]
MEVRIFMAFLAGVFDILLLADGNSESSLYQMLPFLSTLVLKNGKATAYVCQNYSCSLPVTSASELQTLLVK